MEEYTTSDDDGLSDQYQTHGTQKDSLPHIAHPWRTLVLTCELSFL